MRMKRSVVTTVIGGVGIAALLATAPTAQIRPDERGNKTASFFGVDWSKGDAPLAGEAREDAHKRLSSYTPDPQKYPIPRTPWDGKPYLGGVWWPGDLVIERPRVPLESLYRTGPEIRARRESTALANWRDGFSRPAFHCIPTDVVDGNLGGAIATQVVHGPGVMAVFPDAGAFRLIGIGDGPRNKSRRSSYMGDAVGTWEGDALVVEITNFKDGLWIGRPQGDRPPQTSSDALRVIERWTMPDGRLLEYQATVYDDTMLTASWTGPRYRMGRTGLDAVLEAQPCFEDPDLVRIELEYQKQQKGQ